MRQTPTALLLEHKLGEPLRDVVIRFRRDERSWRYIARKLKDLTNVPVGAESLRRWFEDEPAAAERAA